MWGAIIYLHSGSLEGVGYGVTTKRLRALKSLSVLDVLHASLVGLGARVEVYPGEDGRGGGYPGEDGGRGGGLYLGDDGAEPA